MKCRTKIFTSALIILVISFAGLNAQIAGFNKIRWEREKVARGLIWKSSHTLMIDSLPQNINILLVNLRKRSITLNYNPSENSPVSMQAESAGAIAAVNGGFFNIKNAGSVTYIKTGGRIIDSDTADKWPHNVNMNGAIMLKKGREIHIGRAVSNSHLDSLKDYDDIVVTGPLLVENNTPVILPETSLVINRHPRTAAGSRNRRRAVLLTLDGRTGEAAGMTLTELSRLMIRLRCRDAVNLDGGGSTAMWLRGKPFRGVVNMPCDNRKFDHEGERPVSDILIVK